MSIKERPYGVCEVKFLTNDKPSKKKYTYFLRKKEYDFLLYVALHEKFNVFNITNEKGYDYRKTEVIFLGTYKFEDYYSFLEYDIDYMFLDKISLIEKYKDFSTNNNSSLSEELILMSDIINNNEIKKRKENKNMFNNLMKNVNFGKVETVELSMYGPAFRNAEGECISYDKDKKEWVDVTNLVFDFGMTYMMPVSKKDIKEDDFILHNGLWVRVLETNSDNIVVEKIFEKEITTIILTKNLFGFDFATKLIYFGLNEMNLANEDNPFGNLLPLMLMENRNEDMLPMILMMQMNKEGASVMDFSNPMMMYMMMKDSNSNMLPFLLMNMNK